MAEIHKLTKNGETILPATTTDAVVHPELQTPLTSLINEYNVSTLFPTSGIDGTNKYDLQTAINLLDEKLAPEQKTVGIKVAFYTNDNMYNSFSFVGYHNNVISNPNYWVDTVQEDAISLLANSKTIPILRGRYILYDTGSYVLYENSGCSPYISLTNIEEIHVGPINDTASVVAFYDKYKNYLKDISIQGDYAIIDNYKNIKITDEIRQKASYFRTCFWCNTDKDFQEVSKNIYISQFVNDPYGFNQQLKQRPLIFKTNIGSLTKEDLYYAIKELYISNTEEDLNIMKSANKIQFQICAAIPYEYKNTTYYNTLFRFWCKNAEDVTLSTITFYQKYNVDTNQETALSLLKNIGNFNDNYIVIDWDYLINKYPSIVTNGVGNSNTIDINDVFDLDYVTNINNFPIISSIKNKYDLKSLIVNKNIKDHQLGLSNYQKPTTDIIHFIIYGQSLSTGQQTCPQLSRNNFRGNLMIGNNEWAYGTGDNSRDRINLLQAVSTKGIDYIPTNNSDQTNGETPNVNMSNAAKNLLDNYLLNLADRKILSSSCGTGGRSIEMLSKNNPNNSGSLYNNFLNTLDKAKELVGEKSLSCSSIIWMQGEYNAISEPKQGWTNDKPATNNKNDYKAYLIGGTTSDEIKHNGLLNDMIQDVKSKYSQENEPIILGYQIGPYYSKSRDIPIDMALLEANNEFRNFTIAAPTYCVTDRSGHLDPNGTRWLGEYFAKVWYYKVILNKVWKPLQPNKISKTGTNKLQITFDVPVPPLKFDTNLVRNVKNYGFLINNVENTITSIKIINENTIEIYTNTDIIGKDLEISYAGNTYTYGNLRDSDMWVSFAKYEDLNTIVENPPGVSFHPNWEPKDETGNIIYNKNYPCYNWCLRFYYKLSKDENELIINT